MLALIVLFVVLCLGWRYPGAALAGVFFGFPVSLLSGVPGITPAYTGAALVLMLVRHNQQLARLQINAMDAALAGFIFVATASTLWSHAPEPLGPWLALMQPLLSIYVIAKLAVSYGNSNERLDEFVITFAILSIFCAAMLALVADTSGARLRIEGYNNVAVGLTQGFVIGSICGFSMLLKSNGLLVRLIGLGAIVVPFYGILLTGTRGAFLAVTAGWGAMIFMTYGIKRLAMSAVFLAPAMFLVINLLPARLLVFLPEFRIFRFETYGAALDASSRARYRGYDAAWKLILDEPIFGKGLGVASRQVTR